MKFKQMRFTMLNGFKKIGKIKLMQKKEKRRL